MKGVHLLIVSVLIVHALCYESLPVKKNSDGEPSITAVAKLSSARAAHTATVLDDGRLLVAGGMLENGRFHDSAELFDPRTRRFEQIESRMTTRRVSHTAALLPDGLVLLAGGWANSDGPTSTAELFDPKELEFSSTGSLLIGRSGHTATVAKDGRVIFIGGRNKSEILRSVEAFDPVKHTFSKIGELNTPRSLHTATLLENGRILVTGGEREFNRVTASAEVFDPVSGKSETLESALSSERYKHDAVRLANGKVLVLGGSDARDGRARSTRAEVYDPGRRVFERVGDLNYPRFKINGTSVLLKDGRVLVAGGASRTEVFDPEKGKFSVVDGDLGDRFHFASATLLENGETLIIGGYRFRTSSGPIGTNRAWVFGG